MCLLAARNFSTSAGLDGAGFSDMIGFYQPAG